RIPCASFLSLALLPLEVGCGGDDGDDGMLAGAAVDAGVVSAGDGGPQLTCPVAESPAAVAALTDAVAGQQTQRPEHQAEGAPDDPQTYFVFGGVGDMDLVELDLWDGYGVFTTTEDRRVLPGTYTIEGDEAVVATCGICFFLLGDVDQGAGTTQGIYIATAGTLVLESIDGDVTGSAESITVTQVDPVTGEHLSGGCTATFPSIAFSAPIPPQE